ncbi:MAG: DNA-binding protein [Clostridia bacterium]|nr:DNA-binding protein [Clostridia bacterium]MBN2882111.1 DNA-binding protein [Clostridia bacterium]
MKSKKYNDAFYLRIDRGEEIIGSISKFCTDNKIRAGLISGLGSVSEAELGLFDVDEKKFIKKEFKGIHEIASMNGNISVMDDETYLHIHAVLSDRECRAYGGHFAKGVVGATFEVIIMPVKGNPGRKFEETVGLNMLDFSD